MPARQLLSAVELDVRKWGSCGGGRSRGDCRHAGDGAGSPALRQLRAGSSWGRIGKLTARLSLAERSNALVSIKRLCVSAAAACWVTKPSDMRFLRIAASVSLQST